MKNYWLVKQEPSDYSWSDFVADGSTSWTGVRNFSARNNLRRMSKADQVLFYHSGEDKAAAASSHACQNKIEAAAEEHCPGPPIAALGDAAGRQRVPDDRQMAG